MSKQVVRRVIAEAASIETQESAVFNLEQAAAFLGLSARHLRRLEAVGAIPTARRLPFGSRARIYSVEEIKELRGRIFARTR